MKVREYKEELKQHQKSYDIENVIMISLLIISNYINYNHIFPENMILRIITALLSLTGIIVIIILFVQRHETHKKEREYIVLKIRRHTSPPASWTSDMTRTNISHRVYNFLLDYDMSESMFEEFAQEAICDGIDKYQKKNPLDNPPSHNLPDGYYVMYYD